MSIDSRLTIDHWNRTPLYLSEEERYETYPWLYEAAEFRDHPGQDVLEIGCGTGCDLLQFAKHGARAVGIDITSEHLRLARSRVGGMAEILYGDARSLPFRGRSFDYVFSHGVLHHIEEPRKVVGEIFRVLRPGGQFNVHVYARWSYSSFVLMLKHGFAWKLWIENSREPVHIDLYSRRQLCRLFAPVPITIDRFDFSHAQVLGRWIGWFLVAKGSAPASARYSRDGDD
jgi:SAM-dependent methyltransferase